MSFRVWTYPYTLLEERFCFCVLNDISNEKRKEMLERTFIHDAMNTVGGIYGYADILKDASHSDAEEYRATIYQLSNSLINEVNAYRELMAAENDELVIHPSPIDSTVLLQEILNVYDKHEVAKERNIVIGSDEQHIMFTSDRILITRVLGNMVKNALEASDPGGVVELKVEQIGEDVRFSVHNQSFIPPQIQLQIFQRSFTTKGTGRGVGTYSIRLLTENYLKGTVSFKSSKKQGTIFMAHYPLILN